MGEVSFGSHMDVMFRLQARIPFAVTYCNDDELKAAITSEIDCLCNRVQSDLTLYHVLKTNVLIGRGAAENRWPLHRDSVAGDIGKFVEEEDDGFLTQTLCIKGIKKTTKKEDHVLHNVEVLFKLSHGGDEAIEPVFVPMLHYIIYDKTYERASMVLPLDVPVTVPADTLASRLGDLFCDGMCQQLRAMEKCLLGFYQVCGLSVPKPFIFKVVSVPNLISLVYPTDVDDDDLETTRRRTHKHFSLPEDRPLFRRANAYVFPNQPKDSGLLTNTHIGLPPSGVENGETTLVHGTYSYHHYMQDHINDDKWGCAYRALQTLCSWFRFQGYTEVPIPSHRDIQQLLVDVGDKPATFVGSHHWIGSFEVCTVLNQLLGVVCKILHVSTGADMADKGRELAMHFRLQGTPVMIGGGVLAHTILGVDFSETSGEVKFLILDPHYTGTEDLKVIQEKRWCAWQNVDFWDQTAYYNMCMPQRSIEI